MSVVSKEEAAKNTIAYDILKAHNTSDNMDKLQIKFDKLTSHDITFVGIIQTARASGLEEFPIPYVLTNCHNSLCVTLAAVAKCAGTHAWLDAHRNHLQVLLQNTDHIFPYFLPKYEVFVLCYNVFRLRTLL